jgi:hypothetical protein
MKLIIARYEVNNTDIKKLIIERYEINNREI